MSASSSACSNFSPDQTQFRRNGVGEVDDMVARVAAAAPGARMLPAGRQAPGAAADEAPLPTTIGSLRSQRPQTKQGKRRDHEHRCSGTDRAGE